jgi:ATP-dependent Lhr-like helicase
MSSLPFQPAVARWFEQRFGTPTEPQARGWPAIQSGRHTLISAPTGSGKTLAAFLASLDQLFREGAGGTLPDETRVVYVSPLKALSNDIRKNLEEPLSGIRSAWHGMGSPAAEVRAEVRTGDTSAAKRLAISRKPPHILVTTPESFYLLLTSESGRRTLRTVRTLIVDEIHAVAGNRRGSHLALSMERLAALVARPLQRIGLSATQKPIEEVARFLVGQRFVEDTVAPRCEIINASPPRVLDLAVELPGSPLEAVMSNEVWEEVYGRLATLIGEHRTTLVFVNTRRLAERLTHHLSERLGADKVTSHHGSLSAKLRLDAEDRLKRGELKALVATASLELGIDIGSIDLVCQIGSTRSIATFLQRVGRAEHRRGGLPKGRLFPLSRDELFECAALIRSVRRGELDALMIPDKPLDILAQQIVAGAACEEWERDKLLALVRGAYPYRNLTEKEFDSVVKMLAEGFSTRRGRRGALIHYDGVNQRIRGRRGARIAALTSGGAIPDNADYRVVVEPTETFIGTVNEDFAVESMAGEIFLLGNASWRILRINTGVIRVEDARGQPPGIPFWLGEAPARTAEMSRAVSDLRTEVGRRLENVEGLASWLAEETGFSARAILQITEYFGAIHHALGVIPTQKTVVMERFFDETGGMQLVIHAPFGSRMNRAWGLALRKRFCRTFNFELQAAATDDAIVLSLGTQHSFPLEEVFHYLHPKTVQEVLVQALLDAPMFTIRWRWNVTRALAVSRQRGGRRNPPPLQRMEAENLLAAVFPDQLACLENIAGDREVPDHPLVNQTIRDCLTEAMDIDALIALLKAMETGAIQCVARDLPEPSPLAHEILHARPYAFLDNAPLEERRTQAVQTRRALEPASDAAALGQLDAAAIERVIMEAWPRAENADELHDALLLLGVMTEVEGHKTPPTGFMEKDNLQNSDANRCHEPMEIPLNRPPGTFSPTGGEGRDEGVRFMERASMEAGAVHALPEKSAWSQWSNYFDTLAAAGRAGHLSMPGRECVFWIATERLTMLQSVYPNCAVIPHLVPPPESQERNWERAEAIRELVRGRLEVAGPVTAVEVAQILSVPKSDVDAAMLALEAEGFVLRGHFHPGAQEQEWCERRLLARIHRLTLNRLRAEIQPVSISEFYRFLLAWQRVDAEHRAEGPEGVEAVLELLDGYELPVAAWEPEVLNARIKEYDPHWLDRICFTGRVGWGRLTPPQNQKTRAFSLGPLRSSPVAIYRREHLPTWLELAKPGLPAELSPDTAQVLEILTQGGALFFSELVRRSRLLPSQVEQALGELAALGWVTADSFEGLRALLVPSHKRPTLSDNASGQRRRKTVTSVEFAGRWSLLHDGLSGDHGAIVPGSPSPPASKRPGDGAMETFARILLRRYGVVFRKLLERESLHASWFELGRVYRRLEARSEIRGGHFVAGVSGEQFALPEAIGFLRSIRKAAAKGEMISLSAADPLNLVGILTPGPRITAVASNRILLRDGLPIAALEADRIRALEADIDPADQAIEKALTIGKLPVSLRPYYA